MLQFARLSLSSGIADRTTIMNFRHLLERNQLGRKIFDSINERLSEAGVITTQGTLFALSNLVRIDQMIRRTEAKCASAPVRQCA